MLGFLCGGETWTRVGPPIPSSPANSMAKGAPKGRRRAQLPKTAAPAAAPAAPKTTGAANPAPASPAPAPKAAPAQKQAAAQPGQPADIGDICLLPDIARFAH